MKNKHFVYIIVTVILLGFLLLWYASRPKPVRMVQAKPKMQAVTDSSVQAQRDVTLYFSSEDGDHLISETRQILCGGDEGCIRSVIEALVAGPVQQGLAVLPTKTQILHVGIEEGTAILDFSPEVSSGHPGGSQSELLTVYALANSVAVNFPHLRQIAVQINGQVVDTLKGHVDLRRPLIADFTFARQSIAERLATLPDGSAPEQEE